MNNVVLGAIGDYSWDQVKFWVNSLNSSGFSGRKILLSYNSTEELTKRLVKEGIEVYDMATNSFGKTIGKFPCHTGYVDRHSTPELVHHIRFFHAWQLIHELGPENFGHIIFSDVRDLVFQTNPSEWLNDFSYTTEPGRGKNEGKSIIAPSEYLSMGEEDWNGNLAKVAFGPYVFEHILKKSLVYNVGSFAATTESFLELSLLTYLLCFRRDALSDQPSQALLFNTVLKDKVFTSGTEDAWCLMCGTLIENNHKYKHQLRGKLPTIRDDGMIVNENGTPFVIVHQGDRVPEFTRIFSEKYQ